MTLKTFGSRTFAALAFGALTLHGIDSVPSSGGQLSSGSGGGRVTFGAKHYIHQGDYAPPPLVFDVASARETEDEEAAIIAIIAQAAWHYYT